VDLLEPALERVARIETAAADALAPAEEERVDGWRLRFNHGVTRRGNSVLPEARGTFPLVRKLREAEAFYRLRGVPPRVQLSPASRPASLDDRLAARGWRHEPGARVLWLALAGGAPPAQGASPTVRVAEAPDDDYLAVQEAVTPRAGRWAPARAEALREAGLTPWHLTAVGEAGRVSAAGLAVVDPHAGLVGLFSLATLPEARGHGLGSALVREALRRAAVAGLDGAYLQVDARNAAAERLYRRLGFGDHHRYHYRVASTEGPTREG
jgi:ribosomal protein S18 acetylase RimI-like enzyme